MSKKSIRKKDTQIFIWSTHTAIIDSGRSDEIKVTSSVPRGSVLDSTLFTVLINDIPKDVKSDVRLKHIILLYIEV